MKIRTIILIILSLLQIQLFSVEPTDVDVADTLHSKNNALHASNSEEDINIASIAFEHILDSHSWHLWGEGHDALSIPLPVILKTTNGWLFFSSSEFHHDVEGKIVIEKNGVRLVNYHEKIVYASELPNQSGSYVDLNEQGEVLNNAPLDLSLTKNVMQLLLVSVFMIFIFIKMGSFYASQGHKVIPKGFFSILEPLVVFIRDEIAIPNIGAKYQKFMPYLLTVFFLILINNILGLIPVGANVTGNIAFTFVLAIITFIFTNLFATGAYWKHIFVPPGPVWLRPILIPLEFIGIFTKPFALMIRLFANMSAGHIIIISLIGLIFIFKTLWISPVSVAFALFIDILECLVAFLQAYVFTMLSALFIGSAVADHEHAEEHH